MHRLKVLHILHSVGGVDVSLRIIVNNIDPALFENVIVHGTSDTKIQFEDKNGVQLREYKLPIERDINLFKDLGAIYSTIRILRKEKPDIIHAHSTKGGIIGRAANIFYGARVLHTPQAYSYLSAGDGVKGKIYKNIERLFSHFNSILLASSDSERNRGIQEIGYKPDKTELFNNSISPVSGLREGISEFYNLPKDYICTVGRPSFQKNIEMMVEVMALIVKKLPDLHLVLMGVGEYSPNTEDVKRLIKKYNLQGNITLIKWIPREEILSLISSSKLYISTARYEGLPYSVIESLALGKACVVTNSDGNRDLVKDGLNGFVIEDFNAGEMAERILELVEDDSLRQSFEKNAYISFNKHFNIDYNIHNLQNLYIRYAK